MKCPNCKTMMKNKMSETIDGKLVFADDYSKPWTKENSLYCPKCHPISLEDMLARSKQL